MKKLIATLLALVVAASVSVTAFAAPSQDLITKDQAKAIALEHAGYNAEEVKFLKARLDFDDGRYEYDIEFRETETSNTNIQSMPKTAESLKLTVTMMHPTDSKPSVSSASSVIFLQSFFVKL